MAFGALTDVERLILANQYELMATIEGGASGCSSGYAEVAEWLRRGYRALYEEYLQAQLWPELHETKAEFVMSVLGMYVRLRASVEQMQSAGASLDQLLVDGIKFPGFDSNHEPDFASFADALMQDGRFEMLADRNGRCPRGVCTKDGYVRMLALLERYENADYLLDQEQVLAVLSARLGV
ncbi:YfbU family protein [Vogesella indigofera]|uniref:YfbU family protein n=1 Tax=Vogesella indigofera TaxID=45465 RepID=A0ABT5I6Q9_VOGIN|nr:YfbU family protein [Vogesella indigofera]MDC7691722.1 YfbU family protein [Vogesella indigofera]